MVKSPRRPKSSSRNKKGSKSYINRKIVGIECPKCKQRIFSWHHHDFKYCDCKTTFVDGGRDYLRYGFAPGTKPREIYFDSRKDKMALESA